MTRAVWLILGLLPLSVTPAQAFFLAPLIAPFVGGLFIANVVVAVGLMAVSFGISYVATKLLTKKPAADQAAARAAEPGGAQLDAKVGADVPYSLIVGRAVTGGSRVFTGTGGVVGETQNAKLIEIIALADHPCQGLAGVFVAGLPAAMTDMAASDDPRRGAMVNGYRGVIGARTKANYLAVFGLPPFGSNAPNVAQSVGLGNPAAMFVEYGDRLHVRFYDGTQTVADALAVEVTAGNQPAWPSTAIGTGISYVRLHSVYDPDKVPGGMDWKFVVDGIRLYDPRKDTTVGGSGAHRYNNPATHEWTDNVAVICYNIVRGIYVGGEFFYGIEGTTADQLPLDIWFAAMNECDVSVVLEVAIEGGSTEPQFTAGGEISLDTEPLDAITALLKACGGRFVEIGGIYKLYIGPPGVPVLTFDDGQIRANTSDTFNMILPLEQRVNYVTGTYTSPDGWINKVAPPRSDAVFITADGRRLPADLAAAMVQSDTQMQRLQLQLLQRARRERKHTIPLPPIGMVLEPGDVFSWNSARNGYTDKLFEIDGIDYDLSLNVTVSATEVEHADYDWDADMAFPTSSGHIIVASPLPKVVVGFDVQPFTYLGDDGTASPALKLTWDDPHDPDAIAILWQLRVTAHPENFTSGQSDDVAYELLIIVGGLQPLTAYQVRARFGSSVGFASDWSLWIDVTTDDIRISLADFEEHLRQLVTEEFKLVTDAMQAIEDQIAIAVAEQDAQNYLEKATRKEDFFAELEEHNAFVSVVAATFADQQHAFANYTVTVSAQIENTNSTVRTTATAIATTNSALAELETFVGVEGGGLSASVTANSTAISTIEGKLLAQWTVQLDVNGYVSSIKGYNDGSVSGWTFLGNVFQVAFPGVGGGDPAPVFTIANVSGSPKIAMRADVIADGTITAQKMVVGTITALSAIIADAAIGYAQIQDLQVGTAKIADLQVTTLKVAGNAITVPATAVASNSFAINNTTLAVYIGVTSTVTLENGYAYFVKIDGYIQYDRAALGSVVCELRINGVAQFASTISAGDLPFTIVYGFPQTGTGSPQSVTAELWAATNGASITVEFRFISISIMKR